jgi:hypothetical protein
MCFAKRRSATYRKNQARGLRCVTIRLSDVEIDKLVRAGHLALVDYESRKALQDATEAFVSDALERVGSFLRR